MIHYLSSYYYCYSLLTAIISCSLMQPASMLNIVDIGPLHYCVPVNSTACNSISYSVPHVIANLSNIKDTYIEDILTNKGKIESSTCLAGIRELLCSEEYPQCDPLERKVSIVPLNCTQLLSTCTSDLTSHFCPITLNNATLGECQQVNHYATINDYTFTQCNAISQDWLTTSSITEWTFPYLIQRDQQVNTELNSIGRLNEDCTHRYRTYRCGGIGYCRGDRINLQTSREDCVYLRDKCLSNNQRNIIKRYLHCDLWPIYIPPPSSSPSPSPSPSPSSLTLHSTSTTLTITLPSPPLITPPSLNNINSSANRLTVLNTAIIILLAITMILALNI